jgi:hypothetical protein
VILIPRQTLIGGVAGISKKDHLQKSWGDLEGQCVRDSRIQVKFKKVERFECLARVIRTMFDDLWDNSNIPG